jgi:hypothetical protein
MPPVENMLAHGRFPENMEPVDSAKQRITPVTSDVCLQIYCACLSGVLAHGSWGQNFDSVAEYARQMTQAAIAEIKEF